MGAMDYEVIRRISEEDGIANQRAKAEHLFQHSLYAIEQIPIGGGDMGNSFWPGESEVCQKLQSQECFFDFLKGLFGGNLPDFLLKHYERFKKNGEQMKKLASLNSEDRRNLPTSEFFPYFEDFNLAVRTHFRQAWLNGVSLDDLVFTSDFISRGGFADIYKVNDKAGKSYALKLFHPVQKLGLQEGRWSMYWAINQNLFKNRDLFLQRPFAILRGSAVGNCYLMDFITGENVEKALNSKGIAQELKGSTLLTYAEMLANLHAKGYVFVDNNWGAVIVGGNEPSIVDYDCVSSIEDSAQEGHFSRKIMKWRYASKEQILNESISTLSDLEGFARMTAHLIVGGRFFTDEIHTDFANLRMRECNKNKSLYGYKAAILNKLPSHLRQVVTPLVIYPRDESLTARDFISAIKQDYRI